MKDDVFVENSKSHKNDFSWVFTERVTNIEKITFNVVQMKFLAMHITIKNIYLDILTVGKLLNIFMEHDLYLISQRFVIILTHTMTIATNIPCCLWLRLCSRDTRDAVGVIGLKPLADVTLTNHWEVISSGSECTS